MQTGRQEPLPVKTAGLETLRDIRQLMERSSRFIGLSGLSGIAAGIAGLVGAWLAQAEINQYNLQQSPEFKGFRGEYIFNDRFFYLRHHLLVIAILTFSVAFAGAFLFTWLRSLKTRTPIWGTTARKVMLNVALPMVAGGIFLLALTDSGLGIYVAPGCLIFYGLGIFNAGKYTVPEVSYLAYSLLALGIINLWFLEYGLYFWAAGFGLLHIIYGAGMWWKYERQHQKSEDAKSMNE